MNNSVAMRKVFDLIYTPSLEQRVHSRYCYKYLVYLLKLVGWLPPEQGLKYYAYKLWTALACGLTWLYLPIGLALSFVYEVNGLTVPQLIGLSQIFINTIAAITKSVILYVLLWRLMQICTKMDELDAQLRGHKERLGIQQAVAQSNYIVFIYTSIYVGYIVTMILAGILTHKPPFIVYNPFFDWRHGLWQFSAQMLLENLSAGLGVLMEVIVDSYNIVLLIMLRKHLQVLKAHIKQLRRQLNAEAEHYQDLVSCIIYFKSIVSCCELMRPVISATIFVQFLVVGLMMGLGALNLLFIDNFWQSIPTLVFFLATILETFPFCYACDLFVHDLKDLSYAIVASHWLDAAPSYKKTLLIFLQYSQRSIVFVAGGIFPISMNSNIKVAKIAFSVITLVQKMNLANRFVNNQ